jgi:TolB-like protein
MIDQNPQSGTGRFFAEMRRRHVVRFIIAYAATAFVVLQLAEIVFPAFALGERGLRLLVVAVTLGFIPAVVLAWIYDITREGIRRTEEAAGRPPPRTVTLVAFGLTTVAVTGAVGWYMVTHDVFSPADPTPAVAAAPAPNQPIRSLAVLPLEDYSAEGGQAYLAAGMHDEIIAKLSMLDGVRVVSRTTSMRYANTMLTSPEIGRELGVDVLIEGSVNRAGDQVRINLQIIHAESDTHLQTLQFDRGADDLLALQADVAEAVADRIGGVYGAELVQVTSVPPAAQDAYMRGLYEYGRRTPEGYRNAFDLFQQAFDGAPGYAEALAGLAGTRFILALEDSVDRRAALEQAWAEAEEALALDSTSGAVQDLTGTIRRGISWMRRGDAGLGDLGARRPGFGLPAPRVADSISVDVAVFDTTWVAAMTTLAQQIEEAVRESVGDGSGTGGRTTEARLLMARGAYTDAVQILEPVVAEAPDSDQAWDQLMRSYVALRQPRRAAEVVRRWSESGAEGAPSAERATQLQSAVELEGMRGYWIWRRDLLESERAAGRDVSLTELAAAYAVLGERDRAYELLEDALEIDEIRLLALPSDPVWDPLRRDPRFRDIEQRVRRARLDMSLGILAATPDTPPTPPTPGN